MTTLLGYAAIWLMSLISIVCAIVHLRRKRSLSAGYFASSSTIWIGLVRVFVLSDRTGAFWMDIGVAMLLFTIALQLLSQGDSGQTVNKR
jgi:hypothetical protein